MNSSQSAARCEARKIERLFRLRQFRCHGDPCDEIVRLLEPFAFEIVKLDQELAMSTGLLRPPTRHLGLSLGDRACLALAMRRAAPVYTAERRWAELDLSIDIRLIR